MPTKKRIQYRYTPTGQRSSLIDPDGGRFTYLYDSVKRLTQVINPQGERTSYAYDAAGRRTVKKLANGSRTSFSYNAASRITSVAHLKSATSVQASFSYQYDKAGNRTSLSEADGSRTSWSYDAAYQLTAEHRTGSNAYRNTYVYDNRGNRILKNLDGQRTTSTYDAANQLAWSQDASGRTTYTFDADGNQQVVLSPSGDRVTNVWDYENKLVGVQHPADSRETMAYDPDGKRIKLQETASTTKYVWDEQNYLQETNASDVTQVTYTNEPRTYGNLISQRRSSASHYYLFDALGSTRLLTDASQNVAESLLYDAWGSLITAAPTMAVPFRWVGELGYLFVPATTDYYIRARVYQPGIGRWTSKDPLDVLSILASSKYAYALSRLTILTDASGLVPPTDTGTWSPLFPHYSPQIGRRGAPPRIPSAFDRRGTFIPCATSDCPPDCNASEDNCEFEFSVYFREKLFSICTRKKNHGNCHANLNRAANTEVEITFTEDFGRERSFVINERNITNDPYNNRPRTPLIGYPDAWDPFIRDRFDFSEFPDCIILDLQAQNQVLMTKVEIRNWTMEYSCRCNRPTEDVDGYLWHPFALVRFTLLDNGQYQEEYLDRVEPPADEEITE